MVCVDFYDDFAFFFFFCISWNFFYLLAAFKGSIRLSILLSFPHDYIGPKSGVLIFPEILEFQLLCSEPIDHFWASVPMAIECYSLLHVLGHHKGYLTGTHPLFG